MTTDEQKELRRLQPEIRELKKAKEILRFTSAFFAQAEPDRLDQRTGEAEEAKLGFYEFTSLLVQDEVASHKSNSLQKRLAAARFSSRMTLGTFDYMFNAAVVPAPMLRDLAYCHFMCQRRNLVLAGPPGIGKSRIAQGLGYEAAKRGMDMVFFKTHKLLGRLAPDHIASRRGQILIKLCLTAALVILDYFAFRSYSQRETELPYAICDERLSSGSIIVTSNRPQKDWYSVFPDPVVSGALRDRLVDGAVKLIVTSGRSYRKRGTPWEAKLTASRQSPASLAVISQYGFMAGLPSFFCFPVPSMVVVIWSSQYQPQAPECTNLVRLPFLDRLVDIHHFWE